MVMNRNDSDSGQLALKAAASRRAARSTTSKSWRLTAAFLSWKGEVFGYGTAYGGVSALRTVKTSVSIRPSTIVTITPSV
jgi:hypothetical protein